MSAPVYESVITILTGTNWRIRVWRTEEKLGAFNNDDIVKWNTGWPSRPPITQDNWTHEDYLIALQAFPRIAAIEVSDPFGHACLIYNNWP